MIEKLFSLLNIAHDKALHALYGLLIYSVIGLYSTILGLTIVVILGISKEIYDYFKVNHTSDYKDAVATILLPSILHILERLRDVF